MKHSPASAFDAAKLLLIALRLGPNLIALSIASLVATHFQPCM
jgi:hypothetical protein